MSRTAQFTKESNSIASPVWLFSGSTGSSGGPGVAAIGGNHGKGDRSDRISTFSPEGTVLTNMPTLFTDITFFSLAIIRNLAMVSINYQIAHHGHNSNSISHFRHVKPVAKSHIMNLPIATQHQSKN